MQPFRARLLRTGLALALSCLTATPALAGDYLYVSGPFGLLERGDPVHGGMQMLPVCFSPVTAMATLGDEILTSNAFGSVMSHNATTGSFTVHWGLPHDGLALTADGAYLYVGHGDGWVSRMDRIGGSLLGGFAAPVPISALVQIGTDLYAGSSLGIAMKGNVHTGDFQFFGTCGGPVRSMTADATHLVLVDVNGVVYRIDLAQQTVDATFATGTDGAAVVVHGGALLVADSAGRIERRDAWTGELLATFETALGISAMAIGKGSALGTVYCAGQSACPCGNGSTFGGCRNSTGFGAEMWLSGGVSASADEFSLQVSQVPANQWGLFYMGGSSHHAPFGDGVLCAGSGYPGLFRFPIQNSGPEGLLSQANVVGYSRDHFGILGQVQAGQRWYFQAWYRDSQGPCGSGFNTSSAAAMTFTP